MRRFAAGLEARHSVICHASSFLDLSYVYILIALIDRLRQSLVNRKYFEHLLPLIPPLPEDASLPHRGPRSTVIVPIVACEILVIFSISRSTGNTLTSSLNRS